MQNLSSYTHRFCLGPQSETLTTQGIPKGTLPAEGDGRQATLGPGENPGTGLALQSQVSLHPRNHPNVPQKPSTASPARPSGPRALGPRPGDQTAQGQGAVPLLPGWSRWCCGHCRGCGWGRRSRSLCTGCRACPFAPACPVREVVRGDPGQPRRPLCTCLPLSRWL